MSKCVICNGTGVSGYRDHGSSQYGDEAIERLKCETCDGFGTVCSSSTERAAFERWLMEQHGLDATWNESRNCYQKFHAHIAWKAWRAGRSSVSAGGNKHV